MKLILVVAAGLMFAAPVMAETYSWEDDSGTLNFTENYSSIPAKYRNKIDKRGDLGAVPEQKEFPSSVDGVKAASSPEAGKDSAGGKTPVAGDFGGKSFDQWKQELSASQSALAALKARFDEIDGTLGSSPSDNKQTSILRAERRQVLEKFTEMKKEYDQQVESARKAGIQVNIAQ